MKILIGSHAMKHYVNNVEPNDIDYFSDSKIDGAETFYHPDLEKWDWSGDVASLDELYTIKVSHAFWSLRNGSWTKHMVHMMKLREAGATFIPELYDILYRIWEDIHGKKQANLNAEPEDFFNSNVTRIYDHDSIHASIAFNERPLFEKILRDGSKVAVSREKFDALSHEDKVNLVFEEVFATALERDEIANRGKNYRSSYQKHLKKLITSYSKGWFPLWVALNFHEFTRCPVNYYQRFVENQDKLVLLDSCNTVQ